YQVMAAMMLVGILTTLFTPEPDSLDEEETDSDTKQSALWARMTAWTLKAVFEPFLEFMQRPGWHLVLLFILLYKFGDALAGVMSNPLYVELGYSAKEVATISKAFGLWATIIGAVIGGSIVHRLGIMKSLLLCGLLQMISNLMFVWLAVVGHNMSVLILTIAIENLSGGMGTAAFVAYLSGLCNIAYTATQYALLSSFMATGRTLLASSGGWLADQMSWVSFFLVTTAAALPGLILLIWMMKRYPATRGVEEN
ncbi:MAG: MFS transporter, partial [Magnetococcales bacterium]|nr:MFS transporter [Magnetococcales bacterium]